ncbi:MAG: hypothetical protein WEA77_15815 [Hyphomonas sp.]|uniref:hypothetical protein n=1 Tax=Hyphomonas sp. TaxID=87 RepID=UPI00349FE36D
MFTWKKARLERVALNRLGLVGASSEGGHRPKESELKKHFENVDWNLRCRVPMTRLIKFAIATAMRIDEIFRIARERRQ